MSDVAVVKKSTVVEKKVVEAWNPPINVIKSWILSAGNRIGSVWFTKRETGSLRKMSYRLHVTNPSFAKAPKGVSAKKDNVTVAKTIKVCTECGRKAFIECSIGPWKTINNPNYVTPVVDVYKSKKLIDNANNQMTVFDSNKIVRDKNGEIKGRGAWRTIPLENVTRIKANGIEIKINRY